jgi:hypothetical protein
MRSITFLIATLIAGVLSAQQYSTTDYSTGVSMSCTQLFEVKAKSGVILRSEPTTKSAKLAKIPFAKVVSGCELVTPVSDNINGKSGQWIKVVHNGTSGYVFDAFLSRFESHDIIFPGYFLERPASSATYIAFKLDKDGLYTVPMAISSMVTEGVVSHDKMQKAGILFMVKGIRNQGRLYGQYFTDETAKALYPGQILEIDGNEMVYADGAVFEDRGMITIEDYTLNLVEISGGDIQPSKRLFKAPFDIELSMSEMPVVRYIGDLDGDGEFDLLIQYTLGEEDCFDLLLSGVAEKNHALRLVAHTTSLWD